MTKVSPLKEWALMEEYAMLLRFAFCNKSNKQAQLLVHHFEHTHPELNKYFEGWQHHNYEAEMNYLPDSYKVNK